MQGWNKDEQPYKWAKLSSPMTQAERQAACSQSTPISTQSENDPAQATDPLAGWIIIDSD